MPRLNYRDLPNAQLAFHTARRLLIGQLLRRFPDAPYLRVAEWVDGCYEPHLRVTPDGPEVGIGPRGAPVGPNGLCGYEEPR